MAGRSVRHASFLEICRLFKPTLIAAIDIGSPKKENLGWAALPSQKTGKDIEELIELVTSHLPEGPVALGFEAPVWVPMRDDVTKLTNARKGEGQRAWSAAAGTTVLTTGLAVISYVMKRIRRDAPNALASLDYVSPPTEPNALFLWEAFVSAGNKGGSHEDDAMIAAKAFEKTAQCASSDLTRHQKICPENCLNLLGAILLRTGWTHDQSVLEADTLVIKN